MGLQTDSFYSSIQAFFGLPEQTQASGFVANNTACCRQSTGGSDRQRRLVRSMQSQAFICFRLFFLFTYTLLGYAFKLGRRSLHLVMGPIRAIGTKTRERKEAILVMLVKMNSISF